MRIFVAGGTGVIGRPIVRTLVGRGHEVTASTSRPSGLEVVEELGARPVVMDGLDESAVRRVIVEANPEVVINEMTALAVSSSDYGTWLAVTNQLRNEGTKAVMTAAQEAGARRVISQSGAYMIQPGIGPTDESSPPYVDGPGPVGVHVRASVAGEEKVLGTPGVEGVVLRYGFFYGQGTALGPDGDWVKAVQAGELPIVGDGGGLFPFIHVDDAVSATLLAVDNGDPGIYNVVGDEPAPQAEWIRYLAELLDSPAPRRVSEEDAVEQVGAQAVYYGTQLRHVRNDKVKSGFGLALEHPSWREGFSTLFD
jgi:2-alkyl-3-oxoalkanoate reductase